MSAIAEWFTLDLPLPPSVNRFMRRLGNKSPVVKAWVGEADACLMQRKPYPRLRTPYELEVQFAEVEFGRFDADNRIKPLSDWMQRVELIENDNLARRITIEWSPEVAEGCRVRLRPLVNKS